MHCTSETVIHVGVITVLLVDDQPAVLETLRMRLEMESDIQIIGVAKDAASAIHQAITLCPDIIVMDVMMPQCDGISAIESIHAATQRQNFVVLTMDDGRITRNRASKAGASAFVFKGSDSIHLLNAIRRVAENNTASAITTVA
jgi:DNA-binding NarL/FixJ family response regulator